MDLLFAPEAGASHSADPTSDEEPPEPLVGGKLDLGAVATEFLLLGIDPYPRKPGVTFAKLDTDDEHARPLAAPLEALKKRLGGS